MLGAELLAAAWALVGLTWMQVAGQPVAANPCGKECTKFQEREVPLRLLKSYEKVTCRTKTTVFFITVKNVELCARPEVSWVQKKIRELDAKAEAAVARSEKILRDMVPTSSLVGDLTHSPLFPATSTTVTFSPAERGNGNIVERGPETPRLSKMTTSEPEAKTTVSTLQPSSLLPKTTNRPMELGEGLTPIEKVLQDFLGSTQAWTEAPTSLGSTVFSRSAGNTPVGFPTQPTVGPSSYSLNGDITNTTSVTSLTASPSRPSSSSPPSSVQRTSSTGTSPKSIADVITGLYRVDLSGQSTTESGWGERDITDQSTAVMHSTVPVGEGSEPISLPETNPRPSTKGPALGPTSVFHREGFIGKSQARGTEDPPEDTLTIFPSVLAEYRTHLISMGFVAGLVSISSALGVYWVYAKSSVCGGRKCATGVVQGLMFSPSYSEAESYLMENI